MTAKELQEKIAADESLGKKFEGIKTVDALVAKAKELGFDLDASEIEKLSDVSAEDLGKAAGGWEAVAWTNWAIARPS